MEVELLVLWWTIRQVKTSGALPQYGRRMEAINGNGHGRLGRGGLMIVLRIGFRSKIGRRGFRVAPTERQWHTRLLIFQIDGAMEQTQAFYKSARWLGLDINGTSMESGHSGRARQVVSVVGETQGGDITTRLNNGNAGTRVVMMSRLTRRDPNAWLLRLCLGRKSQAGRDKRVRGVLFRVVACMAAL